MFSLQNTTSLKDLATSGGELEWEEIFNEI